MPLCDFKKRYPTKESANLVLAGYNIRIPINTMEIYECAIHECWHLGHGMTLAERQQRYMDMNWWRFKDGWK